MNITADSLLSVIVRLDSLLQMAEQHIQQQAAEIVRLTSAAAEHDTVDTPPVS